MSDPRKSSRSDQPVMEGLPSLSEVAERIVRQQTEELVPGLVQKHSLILKEALFEELLERFTAAEIAEAIEEKYPRRSYFGTAPVIDGQLRADLASGASNQGSSLVGFLQSGSGAIVRDAQGKLREWVNLLDFIPPALHSPIAARTDTTDLKPYKDLAIASGHKNFILPLGKLHSSDGWGFSSIDGVGLIGQGWDSTPEHSSPHATELICTGSNMEAFSAFGSVCLDKFYVAYSTQQTTSNTDSIAVALNNIKNGAHIGTLKAAYGYINFGIPQEDAPSSTFNALWLTTIDKLFSYKASHTPFDLRGWDTATNGCVIGLLTHNGGAASDFSSSGQTSEYGARISGLNGCEIGCITLEAAVINEIPIQFNNVIGRCGVTRMETVSCAKNNDGWIQFSGGYCFMDVGVREFKNCRSTAASIVYLGNSSATAISLRIGPTFIDDDCDLDNGGATTRRIHINNSNDTATGHQNHIEIGPFSDEGGQLSDRTWTDTISTLLTPIHVFDGKHINHRMMGGRVGATYRVAPALAAPTAGAWVLSDRVPNSALAVGEYEKWVCVSAGTPGTWAGVGAVPLVNTTAVGNVGTGEDNLQTATIPASMLINTSSTVRITAWGTKANNADAKTLKLYFGTAAILTHALGTGAAGKWHITAIVSRTGTSAQDYVANLTGTDSDLENGAVTETETATIVVKCTGEATSNNDIVQEGLLVELLR